MRNAAGEGIEIVGNFSSKGGTRNHKDSKREEEKEAVSCLKVSMKRNEQVSVSSNVFEKEVKGRDQVVEGLQCTNQQERWAQRRSPWKFGVQGREALELGWSRPTNHNRPHLPKADLNHVRGLAPLLEVELVKVKYSRSSDMASYSGFGIVSPQHLALNKNP